MSRSTSRFLRIPVILRQTQALSGLCFGVVATVCWSGSATQLDLVTPAVQNCPRSDQLFANGPVIVAVAVSFTSWMKEHSFHFDPTWVFKLFEGTWLWSIDEHGQTNKVPTLADYNSLFPKLSNPRFHSNSHASQNPSQIWTIQPSQFFRFYLPSHVFLMFCFLSFPRRRKLCCRTCGPCWTNIAAAASPRTPSFSWRRRVLHGGPLVVSSISSGFTRSKLPGKASRPKEKCLKPKKQMFYWWCDWCNIKPGLINPEAV